MGDIEFVEETEILERRTVVPGDLVTSETAFMRGHGTFLNANNQLMSSVAGETGDVVVGRIIETQVDRRRWRVETGARMDSILLLNHINLPGGELRRKTAEDEQMMRSYFKEGDLIVAEVQSTFQDGSLSLHTRSLRYGRVGQGTLVKVPPYLIERCKFLFHNMPSIGVHLVLANNGYIWISAMRIEEEAEYGFDLSLDPLPLPTRQSIARMRNCIHILRIGEMMINAASCIKCFGASMEYTVSDLLDQVVIDGIIAKIKYS